MAIENLMVNPVTVIYQALTGADEDGTPEYETAVRWEGLGWLQTPKNVYPREQKGNAEAVKRVERRSTLYLPSDAVFTDDDQFIVEGEGTWNCRGGSTVTTPFVGIHHYEVGVSQQGNP